MADISLGDKIRDKVSGYTGIATALSEYINGCRQVLIQPQSKKPNVYHEPVWCDIERVEILQLGHSKIEASPTGGNPRNQAPKR